MVRVQSLLFSCQLLLPKSVEKDGHKPLPDFHYEKYLLPCGFIGRFKGISIPIEIKFLRNPCCTCLVPSKFKILKFNIGHFLYRQVKFFHDLIPIYNFENSKCFSNGLAEVGRPAPELELSACFRIR